MARVEELLRVDPTLRGLSIRERARRWDEVLQRVLAEAGNCGSSPEIEQAKPLLKKRAASLEVSDQKMETGSVTFALTVTALPAPPELGVDGSRLAVMSPRAIEWTH